MKHFTLLLSMVLMFTFATAAFAGDKDKDWEKFSQCLVKMFKTDNEGLKQSAMQRIIQYSDRLDVKDAAYDIYNIYRWHKDVQVRRLALIALYHTNYRWAMNQIVKDLKIESSPMLKRQMICMVNEYYKDKHDATYEYLASE